MNFVFLVAGAVMLGFGVLSLHGLWNNTGARWLGIFVVLAGIFEIVLGWYA